MSLTPNLDVIYEDDQLLAIYKPAGIVVNRSQTSAFGTIQDSLPDFKEDSEFAARSGIVHRLDKDTSGILLIAKTEQTFENLKNQFKSREVLKEYVAVVAGKVEDELITVKAPIARDPKNRLRMAVIKNGRFALTEIKKLKNTQLNDLQITSLLVTPKTGRTHQIRVHLSALNYPVLGDPIYMSRKQYSDTIKLFGRLMLHAWQLTFTHPTQNKEIVLEANLPEAFRNFVQNDENN